MFQPPSGGCVLKQAQSELFVDIEDQPPSGGCVLKHLLIGQSQTREIDPAAFGRLCVETVPTLDKEGWLQYQPPSGGCVLKPYKSSNTIFYHEPSRLRAAVC